MQSHTVSRLRDLCCNKHDGMGKCYRKYPELFISRDAKVFPIWRKLERLQKVILEITE